MSTIEISNLLEKEMRAWISLYAPGRERKDYTRGEFKRLQGIAARRGKTLSDFPNDIIRKDIIVHEMNRLKIKGSVLDLGCGPGQLVEELLRKGWNAKGIDKSFAFVREARDNLRRSGIKANQEGIYRVGDITSFASKEKFSLAVALGVFEYLKDGKKLFANAKNFLADGGYLFIECRNKLFNLFSANQYTLKTSEEKELPSLVRQMYGAETYSPLPDHAIPEIESWVAKKIGASLSRISRPKAPSKPFFFLTNLTRKRQYTPEELDRMAQPYGLKLEYVVYQHLHVFPPRYEELFPEYYNKTAILMSPLGYTSIGAWAGSSFIAVLRKRNKK